MCCGLAGSSPDRQRKQQVESRERSKGWFPPGQHSGNRAFVYDFLFTGEYLVSFGSSEEELSNFTTDFVKVTGAAWSEAEVETEPEPYSLKDVFSFSVSSSNGDTSSLPCSLRWFGSCERGPHGDRRPLFVGSFSVVLIAVSD